MSDFPDRRWDEETGLRLRALYRSRGYIPYRMSKFEEYDLYVRNKSFLVSENILTFTDTDGRLMALKPDVTLSIVRNAPAQGGLHKLCYHENVYRTSPTAAGFREIPQTGLECIGELDGYAVGEVVSLAVDSLRLLNEEYLLDISHMGITAGLLEGVDDSARSLLLAELGRKNAPGLRRLCREYGLPAALGEQLSALAGLYGTPGEILPALEQLADNQISREAMEELAALCALLENQGRGDRLRLDFSLANDRRYYSGLLFRGYLPGLPEGVLSGGRYDNLLRRMGKAGSAIGFAIYLEPLARLHIRENEYDGDVLLLYGGSDSPDEVMRRADALRAEGRSVRTERTIPEGLQFREIIAAGGGA